MGRQDPPARGGRRYRRLRRTVRRQPDRSSDHPLLATSTDGVGTKVAIAQAMDIHDTIGFDLVGMVVDDLVVCGAEPLFMTDYIACGRVVPERIAAIVKGISAACAGSGCALLGGETAEHPGLLKAGRVRPGRRSDRRRGAGPAARRRTGSCQATLCSRWSRPVCTPTATRWYVRCCSTRRLVAGPRGPRAWPNAG